MPKPPPEATDVAARCFVCPQPEGCEGAESGPKSTDVAEVMEEVFAASQPAVNACAPPQPKPVPICDQAPLPTLCERSTPTDIFEIRSGRFEELLSQLRMLPLNDRYECISRRFLGVPYGADPAGEGRFGEVDRDPLVRFDALDCMTYVEQVMAIASADSFSDFLVTLGDIRYRGGMNVYAARRHFVELDWVPENVRHGYIKDITKFVGNGLAEKTSLSIDRKKWLLGKLHLSFSKKNALNADFRTLGIDRPEKMTVDYVPLSTFFSGKPSHLIPNRTVIDRLPEVSIALVVRKQRFALKVGVIVAHMGLIITPRLPDGSRGAPIFRHATPDGRAVTDDPLLPYLKNQEKQRAGLVILEPLEKKPRGGAIGCGM